MLLPWLRWAHRFQRPRGNAYPLRLEERIRNYCFGWLELDIPLDDIIEHFSELHKNLPVKKIADDSKKIWMEYQTDPDSIILKIHSPKNEMLAEKPNPKKMEIIENDKEQTWHNTQVDLGQPIELDVMGKKLLISGFALKWGN